MIMEKIKIDYYSAKGRDFFENFKESYNDIMRGLEQLNRNIMNKEVLDFKARESILDASYSLETALYRAIVYKSNCKDSMQSILQDLNTTLNTMANISNHEFLKILNLKVVSLLSLLLL